MCIFIYLCDSYISYTIHTYGSAVKNLIKVLEPRRGAVLQFTDIWHLATPLIMQSLKV